MTFSSSWIVKICICKSQDTYCYCMPHLDHAQRYACFPMKYVFINSIWCIEKWSARFFAVSTLLTHGGPSCSNKFSWYYWKVKTEGGVCVCWGLIWPCVPVQVRCSVWNSTTLIDLRPLIHTTGSYLATDEDLDKENSPDFYINICQPLNPVPGVLCPPGAAVCMDPDSGQPIVSRLSLRCWWMI